MNGHRVVPTTARGGASKTRRLINLYCDLGLALHACLLFKNALIVALDLESAASLRWLDCYLLGRVQLASRIPRASKYCALVTNCMMIINRVLIRLFADEIRLLIYELTQLDRPQASNELALPASSLRAPAEALARKRQFLVDHHVVNPLSLAAGAERPLARPNRGAARPAYETYLRIYANLAALLFWLAYLTALTILISPMFVTKRGFELLYPNCVGWILLHAQQRAHRGNNNNSSFARIYAIDPTRSPAHIFEAEIPFRLPLVDLVPLNLYHFTRASVDFCEFYLSQLDISIFWTLHVNFVLRLSIDLLIYVADLKRRLARAAKKLALLPPAEAHSRKRPSKRGRPSAHEAELVAIQASLLDYFRLVRAYNPYVATISLFNTGVWLFSAVMIFARYFKSHGLKVELERGVHFEFLFLFFSTLAPTLLGLLGECLVAARARQMFAQIAQVMALDDGTAATKRRWITLLKFYRPRSLFCFTILNTVELSWLYGLKLFAWVLSALFVLHTL